MRGDIREAAIEIPRIRNENPEIVVRVNRLGNDVHREEFLSTPVMENVDETYPLPEASGTIRKNRNRLSKFSQ